MVAISTFAPEKTEELVDEADVIHRYGEIDVTTMTRAA